MLATTARVMGAPRVLWIWEQSQEPWLWLAYWRNDRTEVEQAAPMEYGHIRGHASILNSPDSPAPVPTFDSRYDCYTGDPDQVMTGGAPTTLPGCGPNTRTVMQFQVSSGNGAGQRERLHGPAFGRQRHHVGHAGHGVSPGADAQRQRQRQRCRPHHRRHRLLHGYDRRQGHNLRLSALANDLLGDTQRFASPAVGYPTLSVDSVPSAVSNQITPQSTSSGGGVADTATHRKSLSASSRGGGGDPSPSA